MIQLRTSVRAMAAAVALTASAGAFAVPTLAAGESSIFFRNFENLYRPVADCAVGGCLAASASDPAGYLRIDPSIAGNVRVNDVFVGILDVQNITSSISGTDTYNSVAGDRFTGYFAQRVAGIVFESGTVARINLGTATDPFGILAAGEMFRLYSGVASFSSGGTVASGIAAATSGTFWASLGLGTEGYQYTRTDLSVPVTTSNTQSFSALDFITLGPGYSAGDVLKLNDFNEDIVGGTIGDPASQICSAAEIATVGISCTDVVGTSEIEPNNAFGTGNSPWMFASNDPFDINRIPEPTSLALVGLALAGLGYSARRRSQQV